MNWQGVASTLAMLAVGIVLLYFSPLAKVILWSPVRGRVLLNGEPAAGAVLVRRCDWHWADKIISDRAIADSSGEFAFPAIFGRMLLGKILLHQPVIQQAMTVEHGGASYRAWNYFNMSHSLNGENGGRPIVVTCRLEAERALHGVVSGLCEFE